MKSTIPEARIASAEVQRIDIGSLNAGPLAVGRLVLDGVRFDMSTGAVQLTNLTVTVELRMSLDWKVSVRILGIPKNWDGTIDLGTHTVALPFGTVTLPGLQSFALDLSTLTIEDLSAVVGPLQDLHLGALLVEQINARDVVAPVPDFALTGIGLGGMSLAGLMIPGAAAASTHIQRVQGQALPLGTVTLPAMTLPRADVGDIVAEAIDASATSRPFEFVADAGILDVTFRLVPSARTQVDELRLSGVSSSGAIGGIELTDVVLPYEILDVTLSQLGIGAIEIPTLEVG